MRQRSTELARYAGYPPDELLKEWKVLFLAAKLCFLRDELHINLLPNCPSISKKSGIFCKTMVSDCCKTMSKITAVVSQLCKTMSKITGAIKAYTRALHLNPDLVGIYSAKAHALRKLDGHAKALAEYDNALQFIPEDFFLPFFRANSLQGLKRDEEAKVVYEQAQRVAPDPIFALQRILASVPLKKEAPGQPGGTNQSGSSMLFVEEKGQKAVLDG